MVDTDKVVQKHASAISSENKKSNKPKRQYKPRAKKTTRTKKPKVIKEKKNKQIKINVHVHTQGGSAGGGGASPSVAVPTGASQYPMTGGTLQDLISYLQAQRVSDQIDFAQKKLNEDNVVRAHSGAFTTTKKKEKPGPVAIIDKTQLEEEIERPADLGPEVEGDKFAPNPVYEGELNLVPRLQKIGGQGGPSSLPFQYPAKSEFRRASLKSLESLRFNSERLQKRMRENIPEKDGFESYWQDKINIDREIGNLYRRVDEDQISHDEYLQQYKNVFDGLKALDAIAINIKEMKRQAELMRQGPLNLLEDRSGTGNLTDLQNGFLRLNDSNPSPLLQDVESSSRNNSENKLMLAGAEKMMLDEIPNRNEEQELERLRVEKEYEFRNNQLLLEDRKQQRLAEIELQRISSAAGGGGGGDFNDASVSARSRAGGEESSEIEMQKEIEKTAIVPHTRRLVVPEDVQPNEGYFDDEGYWIEYTSQYGPELSRGGYSEGRSMLPEEAGMTQAVLRKYREGEKIKSDKPIALPAPPTVDIPTGGPAPFEITRTITQKTTFSGMPDWVANASPEVQLQLIQGQKQTQNLLLESAREDESQRQETQMVQSRMPSSQPLLALPPIAENTIPNILILPFDTETPEISLSQKAYNRRLLRGILNPNEGGGGGGDFNDASVSARSRAGGGGGGELVSYQPSQNDESSRKRKIAKPPSSPDPSDPPSSPESRSEFLFEDMPIQQIINYRNDQGTRSRQSTNIPPFRLGLMSTPISKPIDTSKFLDFDEE